MAFISILGMSKNEEIQQKNQPDFFGDLNLDQVVKRIQKNWPDYQVKEFFYFFPEKEDIVYRQKIYRDIKTASLYDKLMQFSSDMRRSAEKELPPTFSGEELQGACI